MESGECRAISVIQRVCANQAKLIHMDIEPIIQHSAAVEREMRNHANSLATRLSTWLLAGHGAALLLCFNALVAHHICHWPAIRPLAFLFLIGLSAAFASVVFAMWSFGRLAARMEMINAKMRTAYSHVRLVQKISSSPIEKMDEETKSDVEKIAADREDKVRTLTDEANELAKDPKCEVLLRVASEMALWIGVLAFVLALIVVVWSDQLIGALCSSG